MSATELEDLQALLDRVLPDPRGFAGRLLQQAITQYGLLAEPAATAFYTAAEDVMPGEAVIVPDEWAAEDKPVDITVVLAAALGACECWGLRDDCDLCDGKGSTGWTQPDPELFDAFVGPALDRLPAALVRGCRRHDPSRANHDHDGHPTGQGENA
jgi:hypothetical protein